MAVETLASVSEGFLFVYLGMSSLSIRAHNVNLSLIVFTIMGTLLARGVGVFAPLAALEMCQKRNIPKNEKILIAAGGSVRGAIAFGLVLQIGGDSMNIPNENILKTTVQIVVLISTIVLGSGMSSIA